MLIIKNILPRLYYKKFYLISIKNIKLTLIKLKTKNNLA